MLSQPQFQASSGLLAFTYINNGGPFPQKSVTLTNTGTQPLSFTSVTVAGPNASDFQNGLTNTCTSLAAGGSCTISVTYMPQTIPGHQWLS